MRQRGDALHRRPADASPPRTELGVGGLRVRWWDGRCRASARTGCSHQVPLNLRRKHPIPGRSDPARCSDDVRTMSCVGHETGPGPARYGAEEGTPCVLTSSAEARNGTRTTRGLTVPRAIRPCPEITPVWTAWRCRHRAPRRVLHSAAPDATRLAMGQRGTWGGAAMGGVLRWRLPTLEWRW